jgi:hypothetical protein
MATVLHKSIVRSIASAFDTLSALMKAPVGDEGAIGNAKQAATRLGQLDPEIQAAYHEALVTAVLVAPVPVIPLVTPLLEPQKEAANPANPDLSVTEEKILVETEVE